MLSEKYGFKLYPGVLKNCDFAKGLEDWKASEKLQIAYPAKKDLSDLPGRNLSGA